MRHEWLVEQAMMVIPVLLSLYMYGLLQNDKTMNAHSTHCSCLLMINGSYTR